MRSPLLPLVGLFILLLTVLVGVNTLRTRFRGVENPGSALPTPSIAALAAQADLARKNGVAVLDVTMGQVLAVDWPDTSLGCPQEGAVYAQIVTPGFRVLLSLHGKQYEYHTDFADSAAETQAVDCTEAPTKHPGLPRSTP